MNTSLKTLAGFAVFGLICGSTQFASAGPIRGLAKAAVRGATGGGGNGNGGGVVRSLAGTAAKIAVQQAIPGGPSIQKQLLGAAAEMGVKGGLKVLSQVRQNGSLGGGGLGGGMISAQACPSTYSVPSNYYPVQSVQYQEEIVSETVEPAAPEAVEAPAPAAVDLKLISVKLVDEGNQKQGPNYRLTVQNVGQTEAATEITVVLLASMEIDSNDNVSALGSVAGLKSGETKSVELRLPAGSQVLRFVTAAVASSTQAEADESDNIATIER